MQEQGKISFSSAVLMSINIMVGVGIYFTPQLMATQAGAFSFLGWALVGILMFPVVWGVATAARLFPGQGGFYNYCSQGLSETAGFIALWVYLFGFLAVGTTQSLVFQGVLTDQFGLPFLKANSVLFNVIIVGIVSALNLLAVELISKIQSFATILKLLPLFFVIIAIPFYWNATLVYSVGDLSSLPLTIPAAMFGFSGFESCAGISHMFKGGSKSAFSVMLTAFLITTILYTAFHFGVLQIMGTQNLADFGIDEGTSFLGIKSVSALTIIKNCFIGALLINYSNAIYGVMMTNISNFFNLAVKKVTFYADFQTRVNRFNRPINVIVINGLIVFSLMTFIPDINIILKVANLGIAASFFLVLAAVFNVQRRSASLFDQAVTIVGFLSCSLLTYYSWNGIADNTTTRLLYLIPILIWVALGLIMFKMCKAKYGEKKKHV